MRRFDELQAFVAVVQAGSFTAAADRLGTEKSAISRRVAALEDRLGVQLLRRTTRQLNLTNTGRSFYDHGTRILADLDEAETAVAQQHGELRGRLKVALPMAFALRHMRDVVAEFARRHPRIEFELDFNDRRIDLLEEGADLALRIGQLEDSMLIARRLFQARTVVCAARAYLEDHGSPAGPEDLAGHDCLVYGNLAEPRKWQFRDHNGAIGHVNVNAAMSATSGEFLGEMAMQGLGIVMLPTFLAGERIRQGELVPVLADYEWPGVPAYAVYPPARHLSYRVRAFIDFLAETFAGVPYWDEECAALGDAPGAA